MFVDMFFTILRFVLFVVVIILSVVAGLSVPFVLSGVIRLLRYLHKGIRPKRRKTLSRYCKRSIFKRLFVDFPDRVVKDALNKDPDAFPYSGVIMVVGEQGAGKTVTCAWLIITLRQLFPNVKVSSNTPITFPDGHTAVEITSPDDIILNDNGVYGCIKVLDEIQNWFNSSESQYFPPEMLSEISQQRKQHSLFIGTSQKFDRISKAIRQQTHFLIRPLTIFGALTIVRVYKPSVDDDGLVKKLRLIKLHCFVQTEDIRNSFDTYAKIKRLSVKGWKPRSEQLDSDTGAALPVSVDVRLKK